MKKMNKGYEKNEAHEKSEKKLIDKLENMHKEMKPSKKKRK